MESWESSCPINLLKVDVGSPFLAEFPLMEVWNIWAFLTFTEPMVPFGMIIYWLHVLFGETVVPPPIRTGEVNMGDIMEVLQSREAVTSMSVRFMSERFRKTCVLLRVASVTITFKACVWHECVVPLPVLIPPGSHGSIGEMMTRKVRLINNIFGEFPLVVSVLVTFLFFPSLV